MFDFVLRISREVLRGPSLDAAVASGVGLLTIGSWRLHDDSPLDTLDRSARWFGIDITSSLSKGDAWLNAAHRHDSFVYTCTAILAFVLIGNAWRLAHHEEQLKAARKLDEEHDLEHDWMRYASVLFGADERRFWSIVWILTGIFAQLGTLSRLATGLGISLIFLVRAIADIRNDIQAPIDPYHRMDFGDIAFSAGLSVLFSCAYAILVVSSIPLRLGTILTHAHVKTPSPLAQAHASPGLPGNRS